MDNNKIQLSAVGVAPQTDERYIQIGEATVAVKNFLSSEEIFDMIQWSIDYIIGDRQFLSAPLKQIIKDFAIIRYYTNFDTSFLDRAALKDVYANYDFILYYRVMEKIKPLINQDQLTFFDNNLEATLASIVTYRNSAVGIIDSLALSAETDKNKFTAAVDVLKDESKLNEIYEFLKTIGVAEKEIDSLPEATDTKK